MPLDSYRPPSKKCERCMYFDSTQRSCIIDKESGDACRFFFPNK